jgi:hypothetical protein
MRGPAPLRIELGSSRLGVAFLAVAYLASALLVALIPGSMLLRGGAALAIGICYVWTLRDWALRTMARSIASIEISADGSAALTDARGERRSGRVQASSYVGTWLVTLVVRLDGARSSRAIAILPDMLTDEEMRRLRVMLRIVGTLRSSKSSADLHQS